MLPTPQAVAERCGISSSRLMALYKIFRAPTSRDGTVAGTMFGDTKDIEEMWVEEAGEQVGEHGWGN
jgi:hypothetical protein